MSRPTPSRNGQSVGGRITAAFGRNYEVHLPDGEKLKCVSRGKRGGFACGDQVKVDITAPGQGVITALVPRDNLLWRSDAFRQKLIAANLSQIVIVVATEPGFSPLFVSRCLVAAESEGLQTLIVLNKTDLTDRLDSARSLIEPFARLGYPVLELSALAGVAPLAEQLTGQRSILVGQSGMGKSTIINTLLPDARAATAEISTALDSGKHTTTYARMYAFGDGWIIDSPGMQAFGLAHIDDEQLLHAFIEFRPLLGQCRFRDCRHDADPGCALREAVERGEIDPLRFAHYHTLRSETAAATKQARGW